MLIEKLGGTINFRSHTSKRRERGKSSNLQAFNSSNALEFGSSGFSNETTPISPVLNKTKTASFKKTLSSKNIAKSDALLHEEEKVD